MAAMRRQISALLTAILLVGCGPSGRLLRPEHTSADGSRLFTFRANSEPFAVSRGVTPTDVVENYVRAAGLCTTAYEIVRQQRVQPDNPSLVIVEATIRCPQNSQPNLAVIPNAQQTTSIPTAETLRTTAPPVPSAPPRPRHGFDASISRLPAGYTGDNVERLLASLLTLNPPRGEFETTAAYSARIEGIQRRELISGRRIDSLYAFSVPLLATQYNPDTEIMRLNISSGVAVRPQQQETGSYAAQNAFGARVLVRTVRRRTMALSFCEPPPARSPAPSACPQFTSEQLELSLSPSRAANARERLRLLVVGSLRAPFTTNNTYYSRAATLEHPYEGSTEHQTVHINLYDIFVYEVSTGIIIRKISLYNAI